MELIRLQTSVCNEIFEMCPRVGTFDEADKAETQLVFVTRRDNVSLSRRKMGNIPQKHIGVLCDGMIYHYSNNSDRVVKWTPEQFLETFQRLYSGDQALFFGTIPGSDLLLKVVPTGASITKGIPFMLEERQHKWYAAALTGNHTDEFLVGQEVNQPAKGFHGIHIPASKYYGLRYKAADFFSSFDHWVHIVDATAQCESHGFMNLVNSYDRAKFTFGFYQLAAHTPSDNLILLFRELLELPAALAYFPELRLHHGRVCRVDTDGGRTDLEEVFDDELRLFMNFLNPQRRLVDEQEILHAARLMHWTANDPACRYAQVRVAVEILQSRFAKRYQPSYDLHGYDDTICAIVADIHHHGRASRASVSEALRQDDKEQALLSINNAHFRSRNARLAEVVEYMKNTSVLGTKVYDASANQFVDK